MFQTPSNLTSSLWSTLSEYMASPVFWFAIFIVSMELVLWWAGKIIAATKKMHEERREREMRIEEQIRALTYVFGKPREALKLPHLGAIKEPSIFAKMFFPRRAAAAYEHEVIKRAAELEARMTQLRGKSMMDGI